MLQSLISWSLHRRVVVMVLAAVLLLLGGYAARHSRLDVFPEFAPPQVVVQTECPGLSALEVEQLITTPLETSVNGVSRLATLRSQSIQGLSVITAIFQDGTDIYRARQQVAERLAELAGQLPAAAKAPRIAPLTSSTGRLLAVGFVSKTLSPMELRDKVQWTVRPMLLKTPGVAQVTIYGGEVRQFQVRVKADALAARQLTMVEVIEAAKQASGIRPAGFAESNDQRVQIRSEGQTEQIEALADTVISLGAGPPVRLRDVANVVEGPEPKFGDALVDGLPAVVLMAYRQVEADTIETTRKLESELLKLQPMLDRQGIEVRSPLFRQADFIEHAVGNVLHSLWLGAALVAVVLLLFLFDLRTAAISLAAIPLSLLAAIGMLWAFGFGLNTLTLGGLAIAVGEVVDDAIIDVENVFRRLKQNARLDQPRPVHDVVLAASLEVRGAVVYATFVVVLVFLPVFFLSGLQGRLFSPLALAYILAVLASLGVALIVTPAMAMLLLPKNDCSGEPKLLHGMHVLFEKTIRGIDRYWRTGFAVMVMLVAMAGFALTRFGGAFLPELRENHFVIHARGLPGASLGESLSMGKVLNERLHRLASVKTVNQNAGRAELGEDTWGVEYSEVEVGIRADKAADLKRAEAELRAATAEIPGYSFEVFTFLSERIKELLIGTPAAVAVKVHGESLDDIDAAAKDVASLLNSISGRADVRVEAQSGLPEIVVRLRGADLSRFGLRRAQVLDAVQAIVHGVEVGQIYRGPRMIDMRVLLEAGSRLDLKAVGDVWLMPTSDGSKRVRLREVADVFLSEGRVAVAHESGMRRQLVTCNVRGRDAASFVAEANQKLQEFKLPQGVFLSFAGEQEARADAQRELLFWSLLAGLGIVMLLAAAYGRLSRVILVLVNLPFAFVGSVLAVWLGSGVLDVGSLIGFATVFGITTRNSMMLVSHWQHLHEEEGMPWGPELVFRGARERFAPVMMTALVTGLGLLPVAIGSGEAGREIEGPMAWVILGGLATSTALNLFFLPILFLRYLEQTESIKEAETGI